MGISGRKNPHLLVIGSGLFGLTMARLAAEDGLSVHIIDRRAHPGGNAWSEIDPATGIEVHKYGSHLFHTSNTRVWSFVNQFSQFNNYQHRVFSKVGNKTFGLPINLQTINDFFNLEMNPSEAEEYVKNKASGFSSLRDVNLEGRALSLVGIELYDAFFRGYTFKQWGTDPKNLPAEVISRLPLRFNYNARYFNDEFEGLPTRGYFGLISEILNHPLINLDLGIDYFSSDYLKSSNILKVYTGPIDRYFDYEFGLLGWRTLDFEWEIKETKDFQGCAVLNYADANISFTRVHEFRHLHPEREHGEKTIIAKEFSRQSQGATDEPYYPINSPKDREALLKYRQLIKSEKNVVFGGRLGTYQYLDMHMAIASAFTKYSAEIRPRLLDLS